jgi:hypothetical protein
MAVQRVSPISDVKLEEAFISLFEKNVTFLR